MGQFCVAGSDERKEGSQVYKNETNSLFEKERQESQNTPREIQNSSNIVIPKLADNTAEMMEIGDDGQLAEGQNSARGAKRQPSSAISTPATQDSTKNAGAAFQYPVGSGDDADNSNQNAAQVSALKITLIFGLDASLTILGYML